MPGVFKYKPNTGVLYPAFYGLLDRVLAASKSFRPFSPLAQHGYRCTLCGEREWLTTDRDLLNLPLGQRVDSLWSRVEGEPSWIREGEHLCGWCALKRLWPTIFVREVNQSIKVAIDRFVISTHTMALASSLDQLAQGGDLNNEQSDALKELKKLTKEKPDRAALPVKLYRSAQKKQWQDVFAKIPVLLDQEDESAKGDPKQFDKVLKILLGHNPEKYYALLVMDGDSMGGWISGSGASQLKYIESWHSQVAHAAEERAEKEPLLKDYLELSRPASPARQAAISQALNGFSLTLARYAVEKMHCGKLIYAGGDDVMAMVSLHDLLGVMQSLRAVYSGNGSPVFEREKGLSCANGFVKLGQRIYRAMGESATASMGVTIAHYSTPLSRVLEEARKAEKRAKNIQGKDAFAITLMKRSGGSTCFRSHWILENEEVLTLVSNLKEWIKGGRRAAYSIMEWFAGMEEDAKLPDGLAIQLIKRQLLHHAKTQEKPDKDAVPPGLEKSPKTAEQLAHSLVRSAKIMAPEKPLEFVRNALVLAEFLSREGRA